MNRAAIIWNTHCQRERLNTNDPAYRKRVFQYTVSAMMKDVGSGDITTQRSFPFPHKTKTMVVAKENGLLSGEQEVRFFLENFEGIDFQFLKHDGQKIKKETKILLLTGDIHHLMVIERVILNVLGRMSGISTLTSKMVEKVKKINKKILITPTRKTIWGWLDKRACVVGGGGTHRLSLDNAILIKHNHLKASGLPIEKFLKKTIEKLTPDDLDHIKFFELEVNNFKDVLWAAEIFFEFKAKELPIHFFLMFDNMSPKEILKALTVLKSNKIHNSIFFEASGGIHEKNINAYAKTGVDILSLGMLTHSAPMLDFSMRII